MLASAAPSDRKLRLFAAARVCLLWRRLQVPEFRHVVEASERFANFPSLRRDLEVEQYRARVRLMRYDSRGGQGPAAQAARLACLASALELCSGDVILLAGGCKGAAPLLREV